MPNIFRTFTCHVCLDSVSIFPYAQRPDMMRWPQLAMDFCYPCYPLVPLSFMQSGNQSLSLHKVIVRQIWWNGKYWMCLCHFVVLDSVKSWVTEARLKASGFWVSLHTSTQQTPVLICFVVKGCHEENRQENLWVMVIKLFFLSWRWVLND